MDYYFSLPATVTDLVLIKNHLRMNSPLVLLSTTTPPVRMKCPVPSHFSSLYNFGNDRLVITTPNSSSFTVCFFVAAEMCLATLCPATVVLLLSRAQLRDFLPNRCLAMVKWVTICKEHTNRYSWSCLSANNVYKLYWFFCIFFGRFFII
jgi:hypothetical protein